MHSILYAWTLLLAAVALWVIVLIALNLTLSGCAEIRALTC